MSERGYWRKNKNVAVSNLRLRASVKRDIFYKRSVKKSLCDFVVLQLLYVFRNKHCLELFVVFVKFIKCALVQNLSVFKEENNIGIFYC